MTDVSNPTAAEPTPVVAAAVPATAPTPVAAPEAGGAPNAPAGAVASGVGFTWLVAKWTALKTWSGLKWFWTALEGLKTLIFNGVTLALAVADQLNGIDLSGFLEPYVGHRVNLGEVLTVVALVNILLRVISTTPAFARWATSSKPAGGPVDEPGA